MPSSSARIRLRPSAPPANAPSAAGAFPSASPSAAAAVNGYVVLTQGTELSVLRPG